MRTATHFIAVWGTGTSRTGYSQLMEVNALTAFIDGLADFKSIYPVAVWKIKEGHKARYSEANLWACEGKPDRMTDSYSRLYDRTA